MDKLTTRTSLALGLGTSLLILAVFLLGGDAHPLVTAPFVLLLLAAVLGARGPQRRRLLGIGAAPVITYGLAAHAAQPSEAPLAGAVCVVAGLLLCLVAGLELRRVARET